MNDLGKSVPVLAPVGCTMQKIRFRDRAVLKTLKELNSNKAAGPDGIPPVVLKMCAESLAKPLRNLFVKLYSAGYVPSAWRTANVQPVPKKGSRADPNNYRPISIT